jgi:hypothetical protein
MAKNYDMMSDENFAKHIYLIVTLVYDLIHNNKTTFI